MKERLNMFMVTVIGHLSRATFHSSCSSRDFKYQVGYSFNARVDRVFTPSKRYGNDRVGYLEGVLRGSNTREMQCPQQSQSQTGGLLIINHRTFWEVNAHLLLRVVLDLELHTCRATSNTNTSYNLRLNDDLASFGNQSRGFTGYP